jgi:hypothetical protein
MATAAATIAVPAPAHADNANLQFQDPPGNIRCVLDGQHALAMCQIRDYTYVVPAGLPRDQSGGPCPPGAGAGRDFRLDQGQPGYLTCTYSALASGFGPWTTLDYGQTQSAGVIACDSEPSGMTCTDSTSGHFFRVSRDSYQLG